MRMLKAHKQAVQVSSLVAMLVIPFLLYGAALEGTIWLVDLLLGLLSLCMLFAMKSG